jgi:hypothetical protein
MRDRVGTAVINIHVEPEHLAKRKGLLVPRRSPGLGIPTPPRRLRTERDGLDRSG